MEEPELHQFPQILSPCSSGRRRSGDSNSPEFEFWKVHNPSFPQPNLLSADELFSDGVLLPLQLLHHPCSDDPPPDPDPSQHPAETQPEASVSELNDTEPGSIPVPSVPAPTSSKRWKDIFKKSDNKEKNKEKRKEKKTSTGAGGNNGVSAAELNINIWPFSRSRSAGNGGSRPRMAAAGSTTRKVSSAPCSRSNSAGESKSRKWPSSPNRGGVHLGRSSPVWQVRRVPGSGGKGADPAVKKPEKCVKTSGALSVAAGSGGHGTNNYNNKAKVLQLNVPMCIGYRHHLSCRSDENGAVAISTAAANGGGDGVGVAPRGGGASSDEGIRGSGNLFNLRSLFTKKVH